MDNSLNELKRELDSPELDSSLPSKKPRLSIIEDQIPKTSSSLSDSNHDNTTLTNETNSTMTSEMVDIDILIDQKIEAAATRSNFTVHNVKRLLKEVLTDRDVMYMFRRYLADEQQTDGDTAYQYEPRVTRSLARLKDCDKQVLPRLLDIEFPDEEEDDQDYQPGKEDDEIMKKDLLFEEDAEVIGLTSDCVATSQSDSGPASNCTTPNDLTQPSEDDPPPALRTRSKHPLNDLHVADLEAAFHAPDATPDLYEVDDEDDEEHKEFVNFLQSLYKDDENDDNGGMHVHQPMLQANNVDEEDHQDPDFNVMSENETVYKQHFLEDMRNDKSVRVPKWEIKELFDDLNDLFASEDEIDGVEDNREYKNDDNIASTTVHQLDDDNNSQAGDSNTPIPSLPSHHHHHHNQDEESIVLKPTQSVQEITSLKSARCFSIAQRKVLHRQISMHVQQLATYYVLYKNNQPTEPLDRMAEAFFGESDFNGATESNVLSDIQRKYLHEVDLFVSQSEEFYERPSVWSVSNLQPALDVVNHYDGLAQTCPVEFKRHMIFYKELPLPHCHMALFLCSSSFPYPKLLPRSYNVYNPLSAPGNIPHQFLPAEDNLLALGFYQFAHRSHLAFMAISRYLLPIRTAQQLILRKTNILRRKNNYREDHPIIRMFTNSGLVSGANFNDMTLDSWIANTDYQESPIWNRAEIWRDIPIDFRAYLLQHCPRVALQFGLSTEAQPLNVLTKKQKVDRRLPCKHAYYRYSRSVKCSWLNVNPLLKENLAARVSGKPEKREVRPKSTSTVKKQSASCTAKSQKLSTPSIPISHGATGLTNYPLIRLSDASGLNANYVPVPATVFLPADGSKGTPLVMTNPGEAFQLSTLAQHNGSNAEFSAVSKAEPLTINSLMENFMNPERSTAVDMQTISVSHSQSMLFASASSQPQCSYVINLTDNCATSSYPYESEAPYFHNNQQGMIDDKATLNDSLGEGFLAMLIQNNSSICKEDFSDELLGEEQALITSFDSTEHQIQPTLIKSELQDELYNPTFEFQSNIQSQNSINDNYEPVNETGDFHNQTNTSITTQVDNCSLSSLIHTEQNSLEDLARELTSNKTNSMNSSYSKKDKRIKKTLKMLSRKPHSPYKLESFASKSLRKARQYLLTNSQINKKERKLTTPTPVSTNTPSHADNILRVTEQEDDDRQPQSTINENDATKKCKMASSTANSVLSNRLAQSEFYDSLKQYVMSYQKKKLSGAEILRARRFKTKCHLQNVCDVLTDYYDIDDKIDDEKDIKQAESFLRRMRQHLIKRIPTRSSPVPSSAAVTSSSLGTVSAAHNTDNTNKCQRASTKFQKWRSDEKAYEEALAVLCDLSVCVSSGDESALDFSVIQMWRSVAPLLSEELKQDLMSMLTLRQVVYLDLLPQYIRLKLIDHFYERLKLLIPQKRYWGRLRNLLTIELTDEMKVLKHCASHLRHNFYLRSEVITLNANHTPFSGFDAAIEIDNSLTKEKTATPTSSPTKPVTSSAAASQLLLFEEDNSLAMPAGQSHKRLTCYCPCHETQRPRIKPKKVDNLGLRHCVRCGLRVYKGIVYMDECNFHLTNVTIKWPPTFTPKCNMKKNMDLNKTLSLSKKNLSTSAAAASQKSTDSVVNKRRSYARRKSFASLQTFLNSPNSGADPSGLWINLENKCVHSDTTNPPACNNKVNNPVNDSSSPPSCKDKGGEPSDEILRESSTLSKSVLSFNENACFNTDSFKRSINLSDSPYNHHHQHDNHNPHSKITSHISLDATPDKSSSSNTALPIDPAASNLLDSDTNVTNNIPPCSLSWTQDDDRIILEHCQKQGYSMRSYEAVGKILNDNSAKKSSSSSSSSTTIADPRKSWQDVRSRIKFLWKTYFESVGQDYYSDEFEEASDEDI